MSKSTLEWEGLQYLFLLMCKAFVEMSNNSRKLAWNEVCWKKAMWVKRHLRKPTDTIVAQPCCPPPRTKHQRHQVYLPMMRLIYIGKPNWMYLFLVQIQLREEEEEEEEEGEGEGNTWSWKPVATYTKCICTIFALLKLHDMEPIIFVTNIARNAKLPYLKSDL